MCKRLDYLTGMVCGIYHCFEGGNLRQWQQLMIKHSPLNKT